MIFCTAIVLAGLAWTASPHLRWTTATFLRDYQIYRELDQPTSIGMRLEFWEKSLRFFAEAPIIGHGTGSTRGLFEQAATGPKVLAGGVDRIAGRGAEYFHFAIQFSHIRFHCGMDVRARRGHCRRNGAQDRLARTNIGAAQFR